MPYTFTQKCIKEIEIENLTTEQFLEIALQASNSLGWISGSVNQCGFTAYTNNGLFNWNAEVKVHMNGNTARLISQSRNIRRIEFNKDQLNLENFIGTINALKGQKTQEPVSSYFEADAIVA